METILSDMHVRMHVLAFFCCHVSLTRMFSIIPDTADLRPKPGVPWPKFDGVISMNVLMTRCIANGKRLGQWLYSMEKASH